MEKLYKKWCGLHITTYMKESLTLHVRKHAVLCLCSIVFSFLHPLRPSSLKILLSCSPLYSCLYVFKCRVYIENVVFDSLSGLLPLTPRSPIPSTCLQKCSLVSLPLASNPLCIITRSSVHWLVGIALALYLGHYG